MAYGPGETRFVEEKRHFEKPIPISDLVLLDRERCILCDRCTRFAKEVAGDPLIHFQDRGNQTQVNTFPDHPFASYFCGNTVQICPVGALTATPYRFKARPWDLDQVESTCTGCSVGCRIVVQSSRNEVLRYQGVDIDPVNWGWLCDKGRFGFEAINTEDRLGEPLRPPGRRASPPPPGPTPSPGGRRDPAPPSPGRVAVLGGARLTNEAAYAWAKLAKGVIGTDNVDAQLGDGLPAEVVLGLPRRHHRRGLRRPAAPCSSSAPDLKEELPVLFLRLRHAVVDDGATVVELAPQRTRSLELAAASLHHRPGEAGEVVAALLAGGGDREVGGIDADALQAAAAIARRRSGHRRPRPARAWPSPPTPSSPPPPPSTRPTPSVRFLSALRRGQRARRPRHGPRRRACCRAACRLDDGQRLVPRRRWATVPAETGLDATGILEAAADGQDRRARAARRRPARRLPRPGARRRAASPAPARSSPSTASSPRPSRRPTSCSPPPASPRSTAPPPTSRAGSAPSPRRSRRPAPPAPTG